MYNKPITSRVPAAIKKASMAKQTKKPETPKPKTTVENLLGQDEVREIFRDNIEVEIKKLGL